MNRTNHAIGRWPLPIGFSLDDLAAFMAAKRDADDRAALTRDPHDGLLIAREYRVGRDEWLVACGVARGEVAA